MGMLEIRDDTHERLRKYSDEHKLDMKEVADLGLRAWLDKNEEKKNGK